MGFMRNFGGLNSICPEATQHLLCLITSKYYNVKLIKNEILVESLLNSNLAESQIITRHLMILTNDFEFTTNFL